MKTIVNLSAVAAVSLAAANAEPFRASLISVEKNLRVGALEISGKKITPQSPKWSVRKITLHGGKQEGVELVVVDNGKLQFTVVPTRGMGVLEAKLGDVRLGWHSPVKEVVHPRHINLQSRGGLGWLEGFNEWMVRCGLESNGHPGTDKFINNVGDEATMELTLHGKIANIPASEVEVVVDREPPYRISVRGRVDERMFYGPKLELWTEISTEPGSSEFRIADTITNRGAPEQEFEMLYHANYSSPLLEAGATFLAPVSRVIPFNDHAAKSVKDYAIYAAPKAGFIEQVYCLHPLADAQGRTVIVLANKARDRAVSMSFSVKELPYVTLWKNTASEGEGYVTGLEPGTNFPNNRRIERKLGRVPKLAPGASWSATIDYAIHTDAPSVSKIMERVAAIQRAKQPVIEEKSEKKD
ncbi:MAG: aldose 1-epimerase family protein [Verrucomicrobia bacterium]|nr:aldose 1-epimerase family protein [Verrucomicrobiota bacterium]